MNKKEKQPSGGLPAWLRRELKAAEPPSDAVLNRLDYMKEDFMRALDSAAPFRVSTGSAVLRRAAEVVFSVAGDLLDKALEVLTPGQPELAGAVTRGIKSPSRSIRKREVTAWVSVLRSDVRIDLKCLRQEGKTELELSLIDRADDREIRPFVVRVCDGRGTLLVDETGNPLEVAVNGYDLAPVFPGPGPGLYVFEVSWRNSRESVMVEFK